jgi:hypothetical protein
MEKAMSNRKVKVGMLKCCATEHEILFCEDGREEFCWLAKDAISDLSDTGARSLGRGLPRVEFVVHERYAEAKNVSPSSYVEFVEEDEVAA